MDYLEVFSRSFKLRNFGDDITYIEISNLFNDFDA